MINDDKNYCTLYLVRHGETEWNVEHITQGHKDSPLTEKGLLQAATTAQSLKDIKFDAIFSSDLGRAKRTAEIIKLDRDLAIETSELLRERWFGRLEGMPVKDRDELTKDLNEKLQQLSEEEKWIFKFAPDTESDFELYGRFITKLREIAVASPNKTVLIVTHGGGIRTFLMKAGYATREELSAGAFQNAGYVKVLSDGIDFFIQEVNGLKQKTNNE